MVDSAEAAVITSRPLPRNFVLNVEGRAFGKAPSASIEITVGSARHRLVFDGRQSSQAIEIDNPGGGREIALRPVAPEAGHAAAAIILSRLAVR
jgi:hypothetical protein